MVKNHIITVANKAGGYYEILKESCIRNGTELTTLAFGEKWGGFVWRLQKIHKYLQTLDPDDTVIISDGFDVVMLNHIDVFNKEYEKFGKSIVISTSSEIAFAKYYAKRMFGTYNCNGDEHYICGGLYVGKCIDLIKMFEIMDTEYGFDAYEDDQLLITTFLNDHPDFCEKYVTVDSESRLFANVTRDNIVDLLFQRESSHSIRCKNNQICLNKYDHHPCFMHGPGSINLKPYIEYLGYDNVPDIPPYTNDRVMYYKGLFIAGLTMFDYITYFLIVTIIILVAVMIGKGVGYKHNKLKLLKNRNKESLTT
jgi:hypothetical protein